FAWGQLGYVPLMIALILVNYWLGRKLELQRDNVRIVGYLLAFGIALDLGLLVFFKVLLSYGGDMITLLRIHIPRLVADWLKTAQYPLGISYVSFQAISYLIDVRRKTCNAENSLLSFSFYIFFFPKIIAGPITRYATMAQQLAEPVISHKEIAVGTRRFIFGLAKKVLIADVLGKIVSAAFKLESPNYPPATAWFVIACFALQIYFDFSGYSDMAIGLGKMLGFSLIENFNYPYFARSLGDFWRRWHISLSSWFRDYVFYPLERHRVPFIGQPLNILIVFLLTGLWHGINLPFVLWGLWHGLFIALESLFLGRRLVQAPVVAHVYSLVVILLGWVFFRSPSTEFAIQFLQRLFGDAKNITLLPFTETMPLPIIDPSVWLAFAFGILFSFPVVPAIQTVMTRMLSRYKSMELPFKIAYDVIALLFLLASVSMLVSSAFAPNIYKNF